MLSRLSTAILRPIAARRQPPARNFGVGPTPYEKIFDKKSILNPVQGAKDITILVMVVIVGVGCAGGALFAVYCLFHNRELRRRPTRPYSWQDVQPGYLTKFFGNNKRYELDPTIKKMTDLLGNMNDEKKLMLKDLQRQEKHE